MFTIAGCRERGCFTLFIVVVCGVTTGSDRLGKAISFPKLKVGGDQYVT